MIASTLRQRQGRVLWSMMLQSMRCAGQDGAAAKLGDDRRTLVDAFSERRHNLPCSPERGPGR
jgi:hypothetical protein